MRYKTISECGLTVLHADGTPLSIMSDSYFMMAGSIEILFDLGYVIEDFNHVRLSKEKVLEMCGVISDDSNVSSSSNSLVDI